jgi:hypothetical protein
MANNNHWILRRQNFKRKLVELKLLISIFLFLFETALGFHGLNPMKVDHVSNQLEKTVIERQIEYSSVDISLDLRAGDGFTSQSFPSRPGANPKTSSGFLGNALSNPSGSGNQPSGSGGSGSSQNSNQPKCSPNPKYKPHSNSESSWQLMGSKTNQKGDKVEMIKGRNGELVLRVTRDGKPYLINEQTIRKKLYHMPDFLNGRLPDGVDLAYLQQLPTAERFKYLDGKVTTEYIQEAFKGLGRHVLHPKTQVRQGTLNANRAARGEGNIVNGVHLYNPKTQLDLFFEGETFVTTGWKIPDENVAEFLATNNLM